MIWFLILAVVLGTVPAHAQSGLPPALRDIGIDQRLNQQIPLDLSFRDENGRVAPLRDYFGKRPVILSLVYYNCPMLCTLVLNGLLRSMRAMSLSAGQDYEVVTVSFDPHETSALAAAKKQSYLERYGRAGAERGWHFLTGDESAIQQLTHAAGFRYKYDTESKQYVHASAIMVLTPEGRLANYFYGVEYPTRDLRLALVQASANKIGTSTDQVLLFCFHYDPVTGKYGFAIMNAVRAAGVATLLGLTWLLWSLSRRRRQVSW
jgi:protein SCO1/2